MHLKDLCATPRNMTEPTHVAFPKIPNLKNLQHQAQRYPQFYPQGRNMWYGSVKVHGTNAAIVVKDGKVFAQSRKRMLTLDRDNYGFAAFVAANEQAILRWLGPGEVILYGEWAGPGVQRAVGISQIARKAFFVFPDQLNLPAELAPRPDAIFILGTPYQIALDLDNVCEEERMALEQITQKVEQECPVAAGFGVKGVGEGVVWRCEGHKFKTKGHLHREVERVIKVEVGVNRAGAKAFATQVVVGPRVRSVMQTMYDDGLDMSRKSTGEFIKRLNKDIIDECLAELHEAGLQWGWVQRHITNLGRDMFFEILDSEAR